MHRLVSSEAYENIQNRLRDIEKQFSINIILAVESGSRAWRSDALPHHG
jgi:hypothetical protein